MRYQTEAVGETTWLLGELPSGGAVTITLYKLSDNSTPGLDSNACAEIDTTGIYKWATTNITTPETTKTEYLYIMTDGTLDYPGKIIVGGYVDKIDGKISEVKTEIDAAISELEVKHGEDSWEGTTPDEINDKLSAVHGAQGWDRGGGMGGGFLFDENYLDNMDSKRAEYMGDIKNLLGEVGTLRTDMSGQEAKIAASHRRMAESFEKMVHDVSILENNVNEKYFKTQEAHESFMKSVNEKLTLTKAELKHVIQKSKDKTYDNLENDLINITKMMLRLLPDEDIDELMKKT